MPHLLLFVLLALLQCLAHGLRLPVGFGKTLCTAQFGRAGQIRPLASSVGIGGGSSGSSAEPPKIWSRLHAGETSTANYEILARNAILLVSVLPVTNTTFHSISKQLNTIKPNALSIPLKALKRWWTSHADKRAALQATLAPILLHQVEKASQTLPVVVERVSQYAQPSLSLLAALTILKTSSGLALLRGAFKTSVVVGAACLCRDMYLAGTKWRPLHPQNDSYAVVTGADHGMGREMSRQLFRHGYNLILVGHAEDALCELQQQLREEQEWIYSNITSGPAVLSAVASVEASAGTLPVSQCRRSGRSGWSVLGRFASAGEKSPVNSTIVAASEPKCGANVECGSDLRIPKRSLLSFVNKPPRTPTCIPLNATAATTTATITTATTIQPRVPDIRVIVTDYAQASAPYRVLSQIMKAGLSDKIEILVNAAESRQPSQILASPLHRLHHSLHTNVHYTLTLTRLLAPLIAQRVSGVTRGEGEGSAGSVDSVPCMGSGSSGGNVLRVVSNTVGKLFGWKDSAHKSNSGGGRILFVNSLTSPGPVPGDSLFAASKAFFASFAQSLRRELLPLGVMVTLANVGAVRFPHQGRLGGVGCGRVMSGDGGSVNVESGCVGGGGDGGCACVCGGECACSGCAGGTVCPCGSTTSPSATADTTTTSSFDTSDTEDKSSHYKGACDDSTDHIHQPPTLNSAVVLSQLHCSTPAHHAEEVACGLSDDALTSRSVIHYVEAGAEVEKCRVPLLYHIPGCSLSADEAGRAVYAALRTGRDATTPGGLNRFYLRVLRPLLPAPALGVLAQVAQYPTPDWKDRHFLHHRSAVNRNAASLCTAVARRVTSLPGRVSKILNSRSVTRGLGDVISHASLQGLPSLPLLAHKKVNRLFDRVMEWAESLETDE